MRIELPQDPELKELMERYDWRLGEHYLYYDRCISVGLISNGYLYWWTLEDFDTSQHQIQYDSKFSSRGVGPSYRTRRDLMEPHLTPLQVGITKRGDMEPILAESDTHYTVIRMHHPDRKHNEPVELAGRKCYLRKKEDLVEVLPSVTIAEQERRQGEFICFV